MRWIGWALFIAVVVGGIILADTVRSLVGLRSDNGRLQALVSDYAYQAESLSESLYRAQTLNTIRAGELRGALGRADSLLGQRGAFMRVIDSLKAELVAVREIVGDITVMERGLLKDGHFQDDWVTIDIYGRVLQDSVVYDSLSYVLDFELAMVEAAVKSDSNNIQTIYTAQLRSRRNPGVSRDLYLVMTEVIKKPVVRVRRWHWWDPRLSLGYQVLGNPLLVAGFSASSYRPQGIGSEDGVAVRFPVVGVLSDFHDDHRLGLLVMVNMAHWLPVFENIYIQGGYSWGQQGGAVAGVGVTL